MRYLGLLCLFLFGCQAQPSALKHEKTTTSRPDYAIALHGGAGTILPDRITSEKKAEIEAKLDEALSAGELLLKNGGSALDAVEAVILILEDDPNFNSGKGAVFAFDGSHELDASIMDGSNHDAGAVGGVRHVKNPIKAARAVMENSPHVLLVGKGADQFAVEQGLDTVSNTYFDVSAGAEALERAKKATGFETEPTDYKYGTVGCVALDGNGNLAAGTSTGGMTNKRWNRIGDSPIIGAGTWASNSSCAVSCTGHGEFFIRFDVASDLGARLKYGGQSLKEAAEAIVLDELPAIKAAGGLIAIDHRGNIVMPFNTPGMYRAFATPTERKIAMFKD